MGERAPKKRNFLVKIFQKVPKNAFFLACFFKILPAAQKVFTKTRSFWCLGTAQKINLIDLTKCRQDFRIFFLGRQDFRQKGIAMIATKRALLPHLSRNEFILR